ncbi:ribokinase [Intestinimonas sp. HCP28S3_D6]|uniref:ribokinase n=1 Tax=Intestinimonas sp. HCP28S3_D6 TaxID=3438942 RepID=UPI003F8C4400
MRVLNFGSLNIDYVYQVDHFVQPGETMSSLSLQVNCGGKGLNQSVALARAGVEVWHAGCIGPEGEFLRDKLTSAGVDTTFVRQVEGSTGHAIIQVDRSGQNSILLYDGANSRITESFVDQVLEHFAPGDVALLQNETSCVGYIMDRAAALGMRIALNAAPANEKLNGLPLEKLSWLLVNEVEGAFLAGTEDPEEIARVLTARYPKTMLVLTLGVQGSLAVLGQERVRMPARTVKAVDTTAAGDTFTGYFLRGVLDGRSLEESLGLAAAASALAVTRVGAADAVPAYDEAVAFYRS